MLTKKNILLFLPRVAPLRTLTLLVMLTLTFNTLGYCAINTDSLRMVLEKTKPTVVNVERYLNYTKDKLGPDESEASYAILHWAYANAKRLKKPFLQTYALQQLGQAFLENDNYVASSKYLIKALEVAEKNNLYSEEVESLRLLAGVYSSNEQEEKAVEYLQKSIAICIKHNIKDGLSKAYLTLGQLKINIHSRNKETALDGLSYCRIGLELMKKTTDTINIILAYEMMAQAYAYHYDLDTILLGRDRTKPVNRSAIQKLRQNYLDSAIIAINKAEELIELSRNEEAKMDFYNAKSAILYLQGRIKEAIKTLLKGVDASKKFNSKYSEYIYYYNLAERYADIKDFRNALYYSNAYIRLHDSLVSVENFATAADIQNKYQREKKERQILKLNKDNEIKRLQIATSDQKRNQLITFLISAIIVLLVLVVLAVSLLRNVHQRKIAYMELEQRNEDIKKQGVLLAKQTRQIAQFQSQMNPHFVFNALHNIQGLVISNKEQKAQRQIQSLSQLMRKTFSNASKEDISLEEEINYLNKYIEFETSSLDYAFNFKINLGKGTEDALIPPMMIQPFLENTIKHAELKSASEPRIEVNINVENELLKVSIQDNGKGFKEMNIGSDKLSHSIAVIRSRIELLFQAKKAINTNALAIKSEPGKGTLVEFFLPLNYDF